MDEFLRKFCGREEWSCEICNEKNEKPYCKYCGMIRREFRKDGTKISDALYNRGKVLAKKENIRPANDGMDYLEKAAELGNVNAMKELGNIYENGNYIIKTGDSYKALKWYEKAGEAGDVESMKKLGGLYEHGYIASGGESEAVKWYEKAAAAGDVETMKKLGDLYFNKIFSSFFTGSKSNTKFKLNCKKAKKWYQKAAEAGNAEAMNRVGEVCYGYEDDYANAMKWYKKAAKAGNARSIRNIGVLYENGHGVSQNYEKAIELYMKAVDAGDTDAMINIGLLYQEGYGVPKDYKKAMEWFEKAQAAGNYFAGGRIKDLKSKASACFITTAVCDSFGKSDDCYELTMFRKFRDTWLCEQEDGDSLISEYYSIAPRIVSNINLLKNSKDVYQSIWTDYLKPCLSDLEADNKISCKKRYAQMVMDMKKRYLN